MTPRSLTAIRRLDRHAGLEAQPRALAVLPPLLLRLLVAALALGAFGCSSSSQFETLEMQLAEMQRSLIQLQRQSATKEDLSRIAESIDEEAARRSRAEADLQIEITKVTSRLEALEAKLEDTQTSLAQLSQQIAATNQELQTLRAIQQSIPVSEGTPPPPTSINTTLDPGELYDTAREDYQRANFDIAILGFRQYLERFPDTERSDNALYWIGESYFSQNKYQQAIREFTNLQSRYPTSERLPSALLKKGYALLEMGDQDRGQVQLRSLIRDFPRSDAAVLARQTLENLGINIGNS